MGPTKKQSARLWAAGMLWMSASVYTSLRRGWWWWWWMGTGVSSH